MKLILTQNVEKLGAKGDVVTVKDGYGRNYLIPQGKAHLATKGALRAIEEEQRQAARKVELSLQASQELAQKIETLSVTLSVTAGEEGRIHGTITTRQIAEALSDKGVDVDRRNITLSGDVTALGEYTAVVDLRNDIKADLKVWVVKAE